MALGSQDLRRAVKAGTKKQRRVVETVEAKKQEQTVETEIDISEEKEKKTAGSGQPSEKPGRRAKKSKSMTNRKTEGNKNLERKPCEDDLPVYLL